MSKSDQILLLLFVLIVNEFVDNIIDYRYCIPTCLVITYYRQQWDGTKKKGTKKS